MSAPALAVSPAGRRKPVTLRFLASQSAAFLTSSSVTASIRAGHCATSAIERPVASAAPYQRASEAWLSCA